jgi:3-phenylpropionate/trans-cinnamate dioxygenase ferredoxin reductase subunit
LIVGAGQAGAQAAISLRQLGFAGTVGMVGEENDPPYERPPLSKAYLSGELSREQLSLRPPEFWRDSQVDLITGERVVELDAATRRVHCASGEAIGFDTLIWAAGGHARKLACEGGDLTGVHVVRTRAHVDALADDVARGTNVVIIGGGYIGLETAAVLSKAGKSITIVEALPRVLARVTSPVVSAFFEREHANHGVRVLTSTAVHSLEGARGRVTGVRLADGNVLPADLVVVGIGLVPEVEALQAAGAHCGNGVEVDARCRTSLPGVYAIGDCASHVNGYADGARIRLESVQNAVDQAKVVAANIAGIPTEYSAVPWFWSNQYDVRMQTVGLCTGYDEHVVRGQPDSRSFSVVYLRRGTVVALDCINAPRDFVQGKKLVTEHIQAGTSALADATRELKLAHGAPTA